MRLSGFRCVSAAQLCKPTKARPCNDTCRTSLTRPVPVPDWSASTCCLPPPAQHVHVHVHTSPHLSSPLLTTTAHCTLHTAHCILHTAHCTLHRITCVYCTDVTPVLRVVTSMPPCSAPPPSLLIATVPRVWERLPKPSPPRSTASRLLGHLNSPDDATFGPCSATYVAKPRKSTLPLTSPPFFSSL